MHTDQTLEIVENALPNDEEEFSFEIEELDSQHAMMLLIPLDVAGSPNHGGINP